MIFFEENGGRGMILISGHEMHHIMNIPRFVYFIALYDNKSNRHNLKLG